VISSLLANQPVTQSERARRANVPHRTFERLTSRAYADQIVFDRYIPRFSSTTLRSAQLVLAQPFLEDVQRTRDAWRRDPTCVVLWQWPETIFAIFIGSSPRPGESSVDPARASGPRVSSLSVELTPRDLPVFFDFEGVWARITGVETTMEYPRSIASTHRTADSDGTAADLGSTLVGEICRHAEVPLAPHLAPMGLSYFRRRRERRAIRAGWVERRTLLNLSAGLIEEASLAENVAFVQGDLRPGLRPGELLQRLVRMRVFPFLFATDQVHMLFATLSSRRALRDSLDRRPAILRNLQRFLSSITIHRQPLWNLSRILDHRYHLLFEHPRN
jgi:hypothetical protein